MDSPLLPRYLGICSIMYGTKLRYGLKPKIITYEDHPKNGNTHSFRCHRVNPFLLCWEMGPLSSRTNKEIGINRKKAKAQQIWSNIL